ncbi:MAG: hypothetical protein D4R67_11985 [Bacteroidetes bacterium]|nr:MAG: hypothetical protein D4R67_11985 [Bacteroidota bacterium]
MTYVKVNLTKPSGNPGAGGNKKDLITLIDVDDIQTFPGRDSKGVVITDNIVMKENTYAVKVYGTVNTIKTGSNSEGDIDAEGFIHDLEFEHPGNSVELREFKTNWLGRNIIAIVERCTTGKKELFGMPCAPMRMTTKAEDDKDKNKSTITFKSALKCPYEIADYQGTIEYDSVMGTVPADDTSPDVAAGQGQYQLTSGSVSAVAITTLDNAVNGGVYTLLGSGGSYPSTIPSGNDFILANGTTWTALAGSQITVKAFKSGASSWSFIEQSRS